MKVWKTREGEWITPKEFATRWAKGVEGVSPLAQAKSQLIFTWITIIGITCGIVVSIWRLSVLWWLGIILVAGLGNTIIGLIGIYQKYKQLKRMDELIKESIAQEKMDFVANVKKNNAIIIDEGGRL